MSPREVDELDLWEVAAILGVNEPDDGRERDPNYRPMAGGPSVWSVWVREKIDRHEPRPTMGQDTIPAEDYDRIVSLISGGGRD